jgi:hypothetical protein
VTIRCPERLTNPETGETVWCHGTFGHDSQCLARMREGQWVTWDFPGSSTPPIIHTLPVESYRGWQFASKELEPPGFEEFPADWVRGTIRNRRTGRRVSVAVPPDVAPMLARRMELLDPDEPVFEPHELKAAEDYMRKAFRGKKS